jgi:hypothetical protein
MAVRRVSSTQATGISVSKAMSGRRRDTLRSRPPRNHNHRKPREAMSAKASSKNEYRCAIEVNQNGKYTVRIRAAFGHTGWVLPLYFLASSFGAAMRKLEASLQFLQRHEEKLWFWGVERTDDPKMAGDLLQDFGLRLDRRTEFPQRAAGLGVQRERSVPAVLLAPMRRALADSVTDGRAAAAND